MVTPTVGLVAPRRSSDSAMCIEIHDSPCIRFEREQSDDKRLEMDPPRSMDQYFEHAYKSTRKHFSYLKSWRYHLYFVYLGTATAGHLSEAVCIGYVLADPTFQSSILSHDFDVKGAMVASSLSSGMIIGGFLAGFLEETFKRKQTVLLGLSGISITGLFSALSPNFQCMVAARFFCGVGMGAITSVLPALAAELSPSHERGYFVSLTTVVGSFGGVYTALVALFCLGLGHLSWRVFLILATIPNIVSLVLIACGVPDSPRNLALNGDYTTAAECANRTVRDMGYQGTFITAQEIEARRRFESEHHQLVVAQVKRSTLWNSMYEAIQNTLLLYRNDANTRRTTLILQLLSIATGVANGIGLWVTTILKEIHDADVYSTRIAMSTSSIPGALVCALLLDRVGRKPLYSTFLGLHGLMLAFLALAVHSQGSSTSIIFVCMCLLDAFHSAAGNALNVMTAEAFPTQVRGTGTGVCAATGRMALVGSQFVFGSLVATPSLLFGTSSAILLFGSFLSCIVPLQDMAKQPLSENVAITKDTDDNIQAEDLREPLLVQSNLEVA